MSFGFPSRSCKRLAQHRPDVGPTQAQDGTRALMWRRWSGPTSLLNICKYVRRITADPLESVALVLLQHFSVWAVVAKRPEPELLCLGWQSSWPLQLLGLRFWMQIWQRPSRFRITRYFTILRDASGLTHQIGIKTEQLHATKDRINTRRCLLRT